jgi:hypothetical protein
MAKDYSGTLFNLHHGNASDVYKDWPSPDVIISDGVYGIRGFRGDTTDVAGLVDWYKPHVLVLSVFFERRKIMEKEISRILILITIMFLACICALVNFRRAKSIGLIPSGVSSFQAASVFTAATGLIYALASDANDLAKKKRNESDPFPEQIGNVLREINDPMDSSLIGIYRCSFAGIPLTIGNFGALVSISEESISFWVYSRSGRTVNINRVKEVRIKSIEKMRQQEEKKDQIYLEISKYGGEKIKFAVCREDLGRIADAIATALEHAENKGGTKNVKEKDIRR